MLLCCVFDNLVYVDLRAISRRESLEESLENTSFNMVANASVRYRAVEKFPISTSCSRLRPSSSTLSSDRVLSVWRNAVSHPLRATCARCHSSQPFLHQTRENARDCQHLIDRPPARSVLGSPLLRSRLKSSFRTLLFRQCTFVRLAPQSETRKCLFTARFVAERQLAELGAIA